MIQGVVLGEMSLFIFHGCRVVLLCNLGNFLSFRLRNLANENDWAGTAICLFGFDRLLRREM